jgi:hypothetical protein
MTAQGVAESLGSQLPDSLVADEARANVMSVLRHLPPACVNALCFECRLAASEPRLDVIVGIDRHTRWALRSRYWSACTPDPAGGSSPWAVVWRVSDQWASEASEYRDVDSIWLEFDVHGPVATNLQAPSLFIGLRQGDRAGAHAAARLLAAFASAGQVDCDFHRCYECLPPGTRIRYAGVMAGRDAVTIRLCIQGMPVQVLTDYLRAIGWPGDTEPVDATNVSLAAIGAPFSSRLGLVHLDLADSLLGTIGVEFGFERRVQAHGVCAGTRVLDYLVDHDLCDNGKRGGLLQWPGHARVDFSHELWPSVVVRWINNVKVVYGAGPSRAAKGYLSASWQPWSEIRGAERPTARARMLSDTRDFHTQ